jgi:hypothetical protein
MKIRPKQLSIGSGAQTIALLNTVPVWFEIYVHLTGSPKNNENECFKLKIE